MTADDTGAAIKQAADRIAALGESSPREAPDPVNLPMIRHWVQAMGDTNPVYTDAAAAARSVHGGLVAPPAMMQVWTMRGLRPVAGEDTADEDSAGQDSAGGEDPADPLGLMSAALDEAGFTSVVATNSEQEYYRYLRLGEHITVRSSLEGVTGRTDGARRGLVRHHAEHLVRGDGSGRVDEVPDTEVPGRRVIRAARTAGTRPRRAATGAAGTRRRRAAAGGLTGHGLLLGGRHPPRTAHPALRRLWHAAPPARRNVPVCGFARAKYDVAAGTGEVYGYVVHHQPAGAPQAASDRYRPRPAHRGCPHGR